MGALEAIKAGRAEPKFREYVWDHCETLLRSEKPPQMYDPIRLMIALDQQATKEVLLEPAIMNRDHPLLAQALSTLNTLESPPNAEFLNALIADDSLEPAHRKKRIHQAAVFGLIVQNDSAARMHVERILATPGKFDEELVEAAWLGRFTIAGLTPIYELAMKAFEKADYELEKLPQEHRPYVLMHYLEAEVCNGGFTQWYFNDFGRFGVETHEALLMVGATRHAKIVAGANRLFGPGGPPTSREKVQAVLEAMSDEIAEKMDSLNDRWYDLPSYRLSVAEWDWKRQSQAEDAKKPE